MLGLVHAILPLMPTLLPHFTEKGGEACGSLSGSLTGHQGALGEPSRSWIRLEASKGGSWPYACVHQALFQILLSLTHQYRREKLSGLEQVVLG